MKHKIIQMNSQVHSFKKNWSKRFTSAKVSADMVELGDFLYSVFVSNPSNHFPIAVFIFLQAAGRQESNIYHLL